MIKVGILYICTGAYTVFWEDFYKSFEEFFLTDCERHYFVFTDALSVYDSDKNENIHIHPVTNMPWPLVTLFRFRTFLSIEEELKKMDYLVFSNANMKCVVNVSKEELLPRKEKGEELLAAVHPGYAQKNAIFAPYERSNRSKAYVPYNCGKKYVIGAMNGGTAVAFLEMCHTLSDAIDEDLKKNVIARWHDESHLNHYVSGHGHFRLLSGSYCYPYGMQVDYEAKIAAVSKQEKFDVNSFKGVYEEKRNFSSVVRSIKNGMKLYMGSVVGLLVDGILRKTVK